MYIGLYGSGIRLVVGLVYFVKLFYWKCEKKS